MILAEIIFKISDMTCLDQKRMLSRWRRTAGDWSLFWLVVPWEMLTDPRKPGNGLYILLDFVEIACGLIHEGPTWLRRP